MRRLALTPPLPIPVWASPSCPALGDTPSEGPGSAGRQAGGRQAGGPAAQLPLVSGAHQPQAPAGGSRSHTRGSSSAPHLREGGQVSGVSGSFTSHPKGTGTQMPHYEILLGFRRLDKCYLLQEAFLPALDLPEPPLLGDPTKGTSYTSCTSLGSPGGVQATLAEWNCGTTGSELLQEGQTGRPGPGALGLLPQAPWLCPVRCQRTTLVPSSHRAERFSHHLHSLPYLQFKLSLPRLLLWGP